MSTVIHEEGDEIENIFSNDCTTNQIGAEKPLSPILNSSKPKVPRKTTYGKRRIKLSKTFASDKLTEKSVETQIREFNEESFSFAEGDNIINSLNKLEEIEKNREAAYRLLINNKKKDFCFKEPISPASKRLKTSVSSTGKHKETNLKQYVSKEDQNYSEHICLTQLPLALPKSSSFQTATGKIISISPEKIDEHSKLFEDIINCSQGGDSRKNKYSYLKKECTISKDCVNSAKNEISSSQAIRDSDISDTQMLSAFDIIDTVDVGFKGFSSEEISESATISNKLKYHDRKRVEIHSDAKSDEMIPNKKIRLENDSKSSDSKFGGFSSAAGQKLTVKLDSLNKAKNISENLDCEFESGCKKSRTNCIRDKLKFFDNIIESKSRIENAERDSIKRPRLEIVPVPSTSSFGGFSSASGQKIVVKADSMKSAKNIFENIDLDNIQGIVNLNLQKIDEKKSINDEFFGIDSNENVGVSELKKGLDDKNASIKDKLKYFDHLIDDCDFGPKAGSMSLQTNLNRSCISNKPLIGVKHKLDFSDNLEREEMIVPHNFGKFSTSSGKSLQISTSSLKKASTIFDDILDTNNENVEDRLVGSDSDKNVGVPELKKASDDKDAKRHASMMDKLKYFNHLIGDDCDFIPKTSFVSLQTNVNRNCINIEPSISAKHNDNLEREKTLGPHNFGKFSTASGKSLQLSTSSVKKASTIFDDILDTNNGNLNTPIKNLNSSAKKSKRKLGLSGCKQISIPETKLQRAKLLFDEDFSGISPIKTPMQNFSTFKASTPIRNNSETSKSCIDSNQTIGNKTMFVEQKVEFYKLKDDCEVTFEQPVIKNVEDLMNDFHGEVRKLETRLVVMKERQVAVAKLKEEKSVCDKKPKPSILYKSKLKKDRISLRTFVKGDTPGQNYTEELFCITPENCGDLHFRESSATLSTEDGATVIPNIKNLVGINEIEHSFEAMTGVDPRLIPKGWIRNHYKWIIWKLASYQRMFPTHFKGSLTVEHVMQQLKYRYDREIDKVERSALRKILEKDDAPQKRMVLCVSGITNLSGHNYELELTDGWYGIRTVIDEPLCHQISNGRLKIGTKLVICGAELMNCDGCHPLEVTNLTFLKIHFNCTRRAKWDTKLGYQNFPEPFSVPIHSIQPHGGPIGSIDICIARVYPFRYLDKSEIKSVWRNKRAEERRAQEWENERYKRIQKIEEDVRKELSTNYNGENMNRRGSNVDITGITCPKRLLEIIESSNDPDSIQESLTPTQKSALMDYKRTIFLKKQQEMAAKVQFNAERLKMAKRDVVAVMKLLIVDSNGSPTKAFNFFVWNPAESHVQMLKEESCLTVFNVIPKTNGDLHSTKKTMFKPKSNICHMSTIFKRKLIRIEELSDLKFSQNFNDFDTIGIIVQTSIESGIQEIWLSNVSGRLLLIKIFESPATCLLLDNLKRGQATSACNLVFRGVTEDICKASANHFTVFSSYSKYGHLQEGLDELKKKSKDFSKVLEDCDSRIYKYRRKSCTTNSFSVAFDENEDTLTSSRITSTDIALSLIDMDKFTDLLS